SNGRHGPNSCLEANMRKSSGLTLIELLVVIVIIVILLGTTIPVLAPDVAGRRIREAARGTAIVFGSAQARAIQLGRPVGGRLERFGTTAACMHMRQVDFPAPFAGLSNDARARVQHVGYDGSTGW